MYKKKDYLYIYIYINKPKRGPSKNIKEIKNYTKIQK